MSVNADLYTCREAPAVPGEGATQKEVDAFTAGTYYAWHSCYSVVKSQHELSKRKK